MAGKVSGSREDSGNANTRSVGTMAGKVSGSREDFGNASTRSVGTGTGTATATRRDSGNANTRSVETGTGTATATRRHHRGTATATPPRRQATTTAARIQYKTPPAARKRSRQATPAQNTAAIPWARGRRRLRYPLSSARDFLGARAFSFAVRDVVGARSSARRRGRAASVCALPRGRGPSSAVARSQEGCFYARFLFLPVVK